MKDFSEKSPGVYFEETEVLYPLGYEDFSCGKYSGFSDHATTEPVFVGKQYFLESEDDKAIITEDELRILLNE